MTNILRNSLIFLVVTSVGFYSISLIQQNYLDNATQEIREWGKKNKITIDKTKIEAREFKIEYEQMGWDLLVRKLELSRYFEILNDTNVPRFEYGFDPEYAKELVEYWKTKFDWKSRVEYLNKFPQYLITVDDVTLHYVRVITNSNKVRIPILLIDGWPGSYSGFFKMIDYIKDNFVDIAFDITVASIPGYGYSTPLNKPFSVSETALLFDALMRYNLGEDVRYYIHGEDWGAIICDFMAKFNPEAVIGIHTTLPISADYLDIKVLLSSVISGYFPGVLYTQYEIDNNLPSLYSLKNRIRVLLKETGYLHYQATKPDTIGVGLTDSPVGLMAYILEKYSSWTFNFENEISGRKDGGLNKFEKDELLSIITIYWMTNSITSSIRYYKGFFNTEINQRISRVRVPQQVSVGVQYSLNELSVIPSEVLRIQYPNLKKYTLYNNVGHFAAFENPKLTADDLISFIFKITNIELRDQKNN